MPNKKLLIILLSGVLFIHTPGFCFYNNIKQDSIETDDEFGEFKSFEESDDEFGEFTEFTEDDDEFKSFNETEEDEFKTFNEDEFSEFSEDTETTECNPTCQQNCQKNAAENNKLYWVLFILGFTVIAGILVRFKSTRNLRGLFLIASLLVLGFYKGGCTGCPIGNIQYFFIDLFNLLGFNDTIVSWKSWLLFVALLPLTYIFGRVYCGWICQLGALQELIYHPGKIKILQTAKAQKILKISRYILLSALIIQLLIMGSAYWCRIDPFLNIFRFNIFYSSIIETNIFDLELIIIITLVLLLIVSSVISFRPFCRTVCPVGLMLGFVGKIPGASVLGIEGECAGCKLCSASCQSKAIVRTNKVSIIDNSDCILCGDCIDACGKEGLGLFRKSKKYPSKVNCINTCNLEK